MDAISECLSAPQTVTLGAFGTDVKELTDAVALARDYSARTSDPLGYEWQRGVGTMDLPYDPERDPDRWVISLGVGTATDPTTYVGVGTLTKLKYFRFLRPGATRTASNSTQLLLNPCSRSNCETIFRMREFTLDVPRRRMFTGARTYVGVTEKQAEAS